MKTQINLTYCGMAGCGPTVKEAKQDATRKIEAVLDGNYYPRIISWRENSILVYRSPVGWHTTILQSDGEMREGLQYSSSSYNRQKDAVSAAQLHLAQMGWTREDGHDLPDFLTDAQKAEMHTVVVFWLRYGDAKAAGMSDQDAHDYASHNPGRRELWVHDIATATT